MSTTSDRLIEQVKIQDALLTLRAEASLRAYIEQAWPILEPDVRFIPNWHIDLLVEYLEAVTAGDITRLLINVPPRSMKSLLVSVLWPTWEWIRRPGGRWIFATRLGPEREGRVPKHEARRHDRHLHQGVHYRQGRGSYHRG